MRTRGALSRSLLRFHPLFPGCPDFMRAAQWERRVKAPKGYAASDTGQPVAYRDAAEFADGVTSNNFWRKPGAGGRGPAMVYASCVRIHSHSNSDRHEWYRDEQELAEARAKDPLPRFRATCLAQGVTEMELQAIESENLDRKSTRQNSSHRT